MINGTIIRGQGGLYTAKDENGIEYVLRAKKKFRHQHMTPLVGDHILLTKGEISDEHGWIEEILPRSSCCFRPQVANVSLMAVVIAASPEPDWLLVDKLLIFAFSENLRAVIIVNKDDMGGETAREAQRQYKNSNAEVFVVSALSGDGLDPLKERLKGETVCFSGQSGVGKSTLLNSLLHTNVLTGSISEKIARGKNTTRHAELFDSEGFSVLDTPGFSLLEMDEKRMDPVLLQDEYPEFAPYIGQCRFQPCYHQSEPDCAVRAAVAQGMIPKERVERYYILLEEMRQAWRKRYD